MSNVLSDQKKQAVLVLGGLGFTLRDIEKRLKVRRETASQYLKDAGIPVRPPGGWGKLPRPETIQVAANWSGPSGGEVTANRVPNSKPPNETITDSLGLVSKPANETITDSESTNGEPSAELFADPWVTGSQLEVYPNRNPKGAGRKSACESHRDFIVNELSKRRNAIGIYQDLVTDFGFSAKYASVMRFVRKLRGTSRPKPSGIILTDPGQEAQVDYGQGPMVRDPNTGKYRRTRLFVLTLGYSRKSVRLLSFKSSSRIWAQFHEEAFKRLGGAPKYIVLDNLKEGVLRPDIYDPLINPLYRDVLKHYGVEALPCQVADPDRKGKVESGIGHAQKTPLKGKRYENLEEGQAYLDGWEDRWGDTRIHGTTKRQVRAMFEDEKPRLQPLPLEPFKYYNYGTRTVQLTERVEVVGAYYEVPSGLIGRELQVQWDDRIVRIINPRTGDLLREHTKIAQGTFSPSLEVRPKAVPFEVFSLLARTERIGKHIGVFCRQLHKNDGVRALGRIMGIRHLAKKYGPRTTDAACKLALDHGIFRYHFIKEYLERRGPDNAPLKFIDPLIRSLEEYRDYANHLAMGNEE